MIVEKICHCYNYGKVMQLLVSELHHGEKNMKKKFDFITQYYLKIQKNLLENLKFFHGLKKRSSQFKFTMKGKLKISQKLRLVSIIAIGMNILTISIVFGALKSAEDRMRSFYNIEYKNSIQQMQIRNDVAMLDRGILSAVFGNGHSQSNQDVELAVQKTVSDINVLKKSFHEEQLMRELNTSLNNFLAQEMKVMSFAFAGQTDKAFAVINGDYEKTVNDLYLILDSVSAKAEEASNIALEKTAQQRNHMTLLLIFVMGISAAILVFAAGTLEKTLRKATRKILYIADSIEKGELAVLEKGHLSGDELDEVICSSEKMVQTLQILISDVACLLDEMAKGNMVYQTTNREYYVGDYQSLLTAAENMQAYINHALNNVNAATLKVENHVKEVFDGAQNLSDHAIRQDTSITQLSTTLNSISDGINLSGQKIQNMNLAAMEMNEKVSVTRQYMKETTKAIQDVTEHTDKIKRIIRTINEIAFQTDILALNAAIEAARAGESGRGFSVVAGEVRLLAKKVAEAAKETTELIDNSLQLTDNCGSIVINTSQSLDAVVQRTDEIAEMIALVSDAMLEEQGEIESISAEAEKIQQITRMNTETAKLFANGSEEGYRQVHILKKQMLQFARQEDCSGDTEIG